MCHRVSHTASLSGSCWHRTVSHLYAEDSNSHHYSKVHTLYCIHKHICLFTIIIIFYYKVTCIASEHAMKSKIGTIKSLSKLRITVKNITRLFLLESLLVLCTCNNINSNKLAIFSGIALHSSDTYMIST